MIAFMAINMTAQDQKPISMTFDSEHIDLGQVKRGEKKTFDYTFKNTGTETLKISIVSGCDCTTLDWTRRPIKPGETGTINVIFDSTEKEASETVDVDIYLENLDPKSGEQYLKIIDYTFELIQ